MTRDEWRPDLQDEVPDAKQDVALPDRAVPQLDEESAHPATAELIRTRLGTTS